MSDAAARAAAAVEAVRARAVGLLGDGSLAFATDTETFARGKRPSVLIAIANRRESLVMAMDASEWDAVAFAHLAGFHDTPKQSAHEVLTASR